jgi:hypothetical protein
MKVIIVDIETMVEFFLCTCYDPQLDEWHEFEVNKNFEHLNKMVDYFEKNH